ncbi:hypothetical protein ACRS6B_13200 [Nocardia asteroides]
MNERYSSWAARNAPEELPLAARYQSADPIVWHGSMVYPMYTEQIGPAPTTVSLTMISAAPPAGLRGLGMGLSVVDGYLDLHGRSLAGVDAWSDALAAGVSFDVTPIAQATLVTLTPVWVDEFGTQKSWAGNYGIVVEHYPNGRVVLWCSIGEGPPNFANLVVEVSTAPTAVAPEPSAPAATPMGMNPAASRPDLSAGPPTAPTMPVPRIDATPARSPDTARRLTTDTPAAANGVIGHATQSVSSEHSGNLLANMQSSRAERSTPELAHPSPGLPAPDHAHRAAGLLIERSVADTAARGNPESIPTDIPPATNDASPSPSSRLPHTQTELSAQPSAPAARVVNGRSADSYSAFGPPVAHTYPPEDPASPAAGLLIGNPPPAPASQVSTTTRPTAGGPHTSSAPLTSNSWSAPDAFRAFDPIGTHPPAQTSPTHPATQPADPQRDSNPPGPAPTRPAAHGSPTDSSPLVIDSSTTTDTFRPVEPMAEHHPAQSPPSDAGPPPAEPHRDSNSPRPAPTRLAAHGSPNDSAAPVTHSRVAPDAYHSVEPMGEHHPAQSSPPDPGSSPVEPHRDSNSPGPVPTQLAAHGSPTDSSPSATDSSTTTDTYRPFDLAGPHTRSPARTSPSDYEFLPGEPHSATNVPDSSPGGQVLDMPSTADIPVRDAGASVTHTHPAPTPATTRDIPASGFASAPGGPAQPGDRPSAVGTAPRASEPRQSGDPGYRGALYDLGVAMYRRGEEEQACGLWAQASEAGHPGAAFELGMVRLRRGDPVGAESWWRTAADRREPRAIAELADLLDQLGKHAEAKSWRAYAAEQQEADVADQPSR